MDVDGLRNELEKQLAKNPDAHAPLGFRERFEAEVARYESGDTGGPNSASEAELQRIHDEAEAAANAASAPRAEAMEGTEVLISAVMEPVEAETPEPRAAMAEPAADAAAAPASPPVPAEPAPEMAEAPVNPPPPAAPAVEPAAAPSSGGAMGSVLALVAIVVVLAAAYYFFRH